MTGHGYVSVSIPASLMSEIDKIVDNETLGYKSRSAYIQEAIRNHLSWVKDSSTKNSTGTKGARPKASDRPKETPAEDPASKDIRKKKRSEKAAAEPENHNLDNFGIKA